MRATLVFALALALFLVPEHSVPRQPAWQSPGGPEEMRGIYCDHCDATSGCTPSHAAICAIRSSEAAASARAPPAASAVYEGARATNVRWLTTCPCCDNVTLPRPRHGFARGHRRLARS